MAFNRSNPWTVSSFRRTKAGDKFTFSFSGSVTPGTDYLFLLWNNPDTGVYGSELTPVTAAGNYITTATFSALYRYTLMLFNYQPSLPAPDPEDFGGLSAPIMLEEDDDYGMLAPRILRAALIGDRNLDVYFESQDSNDASYRIMYRNITKGQPTWNILEDTSSPVRLSNLRRGWDYQIQVAGLDSAGKMSIPSIPLEVFLSE